MYEYILIDLSCQWDHPDCVISILVHVTPQNFIAETEHMRRYLRLPMDKLGLNAKIID